MSRPQIIRAGRYPDCIHHEHVDSELIGTCRRCGQVKAYGEKTILDYDLASRPSYGVATQEQIDQARTKGGYAKRGSGNAHSAEWVRVQTRSKKLLIRGV